MSETTIIRHIPPCSSCDLEALESWLTDLAREGHYLKEIGRRSWHFTKGAPAEVPYRLIPGRGEPTVGAFFGRHTDKLPEDPPQIILDRYRDQGWVYVTRHSHCYIFRADDQYQGGFRVEPRIRPEDISRMIQWEWQDLPFWLLMICVAVPLFLYAISGWGTPLLALNEFLWAQVVLLAAGFVLAAERVIHLFHLIRLRRKLDSGERFDHKKDWKSGALRNRAVKVILMVFLVAWTLGSPFLPFFQSEDYNLLEEYPGELPFLTAAELVPEEALSDWEGLYYEEKGLLIPVHINWWETGMVQPRRELYYRLDYYDTLTPAMAGKLAEELLYEDQGDYAYAAEPMPELGLDYAVVYDQRESVILQEGKKVLQVTLVQDDDDYLPLDTWTAALAESLKADLS
ncbi:MAG: DUF2812 domain-containing protein [Ruminiclostridium sp.]|nr:DUF2812 domain-containing protein [Ruminiclostridium sp.]